MSQASATTEPSARASTSIKSSVIAVYPDHESAERAIKVLSENGFPMSDLSIVGRDFQVAEKPIGFASSGYFAKEGAVTGAWMGGLFGMLIGATFLVVPGVGPFIAAGPIAAILIGGLEGAVAGAAVGALSGALISLGVSREDALLYETEVKAGKFLVIARGEPESIERAKKLLESQTPAERCYTYTEPATAA